MRDETELYNAVVITATDEDLEYIGRAVMIDGIKILTDYKPLALEAGEINDGKGFTQTQIVTTTLEAYDPKTTVPNSLELSKNLLERYPTARYVFIHFGVFSMESSQSVRGGLRSFRLDRGSDKFASLLADEEPDETLKGETARIARDIIAELKNFKSLILKARTDQTEIDKAYFRYLIEKMGYLYDTLFARQLKTKNNLKPINKSPMITQGQVTRQLNMQYPTSNTVNHPFREHYELSKNKKDIELPPVKVTPKNSPTNSFNYISIEGESELDYFDWLVFSAYRTIRLERPNEPVVTRLDIANKLYVSSKNRPLKGSQHKKLLGEIGQSLVKLKKVNITLNFFEEARGYKNNPNFQRYLDDGGDCTISFSYIDGEIGPAQIANGRVLDAVVSYSRLEDTLLERYLQMSGQVRRIEGDVLINPLSATSRNIMIFHYLLYKIYAMPYEQVNNRLFEKKDEHLKSFKKVQREIDDKRLEIKEREREIEADYQKKNSNRGTTFKREPINHEADNTFRQLQGQLTELETIRTTLEEEARETAKAESKLPRRSMTISLDTMIKDLKLIKPGDDAKRVSKIRFEVKEAVEKILENLRKEGRMASLRVNPKPARGVQSFTIGIFSNLDNDNIYS